MIGHFREDRLTVAQEYQLKLYERHEKLEKFLRTNIPNHVPTESPIQKPVPMRWGHWMQ